MPWKFVAKLFFNRGLISGLILLGKVWTLNVATACGKGPPFSSWIQDQLWKSLLQLWPLRTNLLKWIGPSHGPVPWKFVAKLFFNKGLVSGLILLGKVWALNLAIAFVKGFSFFSWLQDQLWKSLLQLWPLSTNLLKWIGPSHGPVPWKFVGKLFFNKGLIIGQILLGKVWALNLAIAFVKGISFFSWLQDQLPREERKAFYKSNCQVQSPNLSQKNVKGISFFSWLQDQLWKSLLHLWTLRANLLKWIGPSHGPVPWKFVEKLFFNKGLVSGRILLGKVWALNLAIACVKGFSFFSWLQDQLWKSLLQLWRWRNLFFNKGLIIGQILLGKVWALNLAIAFVKDLSFFSWIQDQLWKSLLQLWPLSINLLKWIGPSHRPVPWKFVEKLFFNKGLVSGLILLGKVWALNLAIAFVKGFSFFSWLQDQLWKSLLHLRILRTNLLKWIGPSHGPVPWKFVIWFFWERFGLWTWQLLL